MDNQTLIETAQARLTEARNCNRLNQLPQAIEAYEAAGEIYTRLGDDRGRSRAWSGLAKVLGKQKEFDRSAEAFGEAARLAGLAGWAEKEIEGYYNQGLTLQQLSLKSANMSQLSSAIEAFEAALKIAVQSKDRASEGVLLISLGFACTWLKREKEAIGYFKKAVPFALENVDFDTSFSVLSSLGVLLSNQNRAVEAIPYYERALELAKSTQGDLVAVADTFANLGVAYEKAGRLEDAIEATDTWREILHVSGDVKAASANAMVKRLRLKAELEGRG